MERVLFIWFRITYNTVIFPFNNRRKFLKEGSKEKTRLVLFYCFFLISFLWIMKSPNIEIRTRCVCNDRAQGLLMLNITGDVNCVVLLMVLKYIHMGKNFAWHDEKGCSQGSLCLQDLVRIKLSVWLPLFKCLHRISRVLPWLALWRRLVNLFIMCWFCLSGLCSLNIPIDPTGDMTLRLEVVAWLG